MSTTGVAGPRAGGCTGCAGGCFTWLGTMLFSALICLTLASFPTIWQAYRHKVGLVDLFALSNTYLSHQLLPDARLRIDLRDRAQQEADLRSITLLFPDPRERHQVLDWGRRLFESCRQKHLAGHFLLADLGEARGLRLHRQLADLEVSDALAAHAAWRRLLAAPGAREADLFRVREAVSAAVPDPLERTQLLAWAGRRGSQKETVRDLGYPPLVLTVRPAPPGLEWFRWWTAYEDWAAPDRLFAARKKSLLAPWSDASRDTAWRQLLAFGAAAAHEREAAGDLLPPAGDRTLVLAAVDRLSGLDPVFSPRVRRAAEEVFPDRELLGVVPDGLFDVSARSRSFFVDAGPSPLIPLGNDDLIALRETFLFGQDDQASWFPFVPYALVDPELGLATVPGGERPGVFGWLLGLPSAFLTWVLASRGLRFFCAELPARRGRFAARPAFRDYHAAFFAHRRAHLLTAFAVLAAGAVLAAVLPRHPVVALVSRSPADALTAVSYSTLAGGMFMEALACLLTLGLIARGYDPMARGLWIDDLAAALATAVVLLLLGNSWWPTVAVAIALGAVRPVVLEKVRRRLGRGGSAPRPAPPSTGRPAVRTLATAGLVASALFAGWATLELAATGPLHLRRMARGWRAFTNVTVRGNTFQEVRTVPELEWVHDRRVHPLADPVLTVGVYAFLLDAEHLGPIEVRVEELPGGERRLVAGGTALASWSEADPVYVYLGDWRQPLLPVSARARRFGGRLDVTLVALQVRGASQRDLLPASTSQESHYP